MLAGLLSLAATALLVALLWDGLHDPELIPPLVNGQPIYAIREVCTLQGDVLLFEDGWAFFTLEVLVLLAAVSACCALLVFILSLLFRQVERLNAMRGDMRSMRRPFFLSSALSVGLLLYWSSPVITRSHQYKLDFTTDRFEHITTNLHEQTSEQTPLSRLTFTTGESRGSKGGRRYTISVQQDGREHVALFETTHEAKVRALLEFIHLHKK